MSAYPSTPLGSCVLRVETWNPLRAAPDEEFRYIDLSAVDQDTKSITEARKIACAEAPSRARQLVRTGDVLVSTVRPNLNGVARVPDDLDGATASTGFCVLHPDPKKLSGSYLFHWVKSAAFVGDMVSKATGASYPAVSDRIIFESLFPLPPLEEQRRIAAILDQAETLRTQRRTALALQGSLTQSLFLEMFGDPVANDRGWPDTLTLGEVADVCSGITKGRKLNGQVTREVPYLAVANVQDKALRLEGLKFIDATEEEIARYRLQKDDLLLTEGGDPDKLGRGTLWKEELPECIHQNHIFRVRLTDASLEPLFLNWLVGSARGKKYFLRSAKQTTGIASINMTQLRSFPLLVPPRPLQQTFATRIASIETLKATHRRALAALDALLAALQQRAFAGQL